MDNWPNVILLSKGHSKDMADQKVSKKWYFGKLYVVVYQYIINNSGNLIW